MNTTQQDSCNCATCPGSGCACGCQPAIAPTTGVRAPQCACGPQCECSTGSTCAQP